MPRVRNSTRAQPLLPISTCHRKLPGKPLSSSATLASWPLNTVPAFFVASSAKAKEFIEQYQDVESIENVKREIHESAKRQQAESQHFLGLLNSLVEQTQRYNEDNKLQPYEVVVKEGFAASTVSDLNFWHNTGATIVAIKHQNKMIVSPGPLAVIEPGDFVYVVGDELAYQRVANFLTA